MNTYHTEIRASTAGFMHVNKLQCISSCCKLDMLVFQFHFAWWKSPVMMEFLWGCVVCWSQFLLVTAELSYGVSSTSRRFHTVNPTYQAHGSSSHKHALQALLVLRWVEIYLKATVCNSHYFQTHLSELLSSLWQTLSITDQKRRWIVKYYYVVHL